MESTTLGPSSAASAPPSCGASAAHSSHIHSRQQSQLMALCVQAPFGSKTGLWNMSDPPTDFPTAGSDAPASMGYQYPLPSMGMASPSMIPSIHTLPQDQSQQPSPPATTRGASPPSRPGSVPSKVSKLKRSISSPNVRAPSAADAAALALSAEKKRNKLGYHRTSVACGKYFEVECK